MSSRRPPVRSLNPDLHGDVKFASRVALSFHLQDGARLASRVPPSPRLHYNAKLASRAALSFHLHGGAKFASRMEQGNRLQCPTLACSLAPRLHKTALRILALNILAEAQSCRSLPSLAVKVPATHLPPLPDAERDTAPMMLRPAVLAPVLLAAADAAPQCTSADYLLTAAPMAAPLVVPSLSLLVLRWQGQVAHDHTPHKRHTVRCSGRCNRGTPTNRCLARCPRQDLETQSVHPLVATKARVLSGELLLPPVVAARALSAVLSTPQGLNPPPGVLRSHPSQSLRSAN